MGEVVPAIIGEVVILVLVVAVVWAVLREFVRAAIRIVVVVAILTTIAIWLGLLDRTLVMDGLVAVGEWVMSLFAPVRDWFGSATGA